MISVDIDAVQAIGYLAASFVFLSFCMKTMLSLRLIAIASNIAFIGYALAGELTPILVLHGALLPLNVLRLIQMQQQIRMASEAARTLPGHERFDWLVPLGNRRVLRPGTPLFNKGEPADSLFIVIDGKLLLPDIGVTLGPGSMVGEIGLFSGGSRRTASAVAIGTATVSELTERRVKELYFDNPNFAYRLIRLITRRLVEQVELLDTQATAAANEPTIGRG